MSLSKVHFDPWRTIGTLGVKKLLYKSRFKIEGKTKLLILTSSKMGLKHTNFNDEIIDCSSKRF